LHINMITIYMEQLKKMNEIVFVDTVAWIALINRSDSLYEYAHQIMNKLKNDKVRLITTEFILMEVANSLSRPPLRNMAVSFINSLRHINTVRIIPASSEILEDGWKLYSERMDKEWSLTDCISFRTMIRGQINKAFTSDHHFEQAGFVKLGL
jgi:uncharacterized protein